MKSSPFVIRFLLISVLLGILIISLSLDFRSVVILQTPEMTAASRPANSVPGSGWIWADRPDRLGIAGQAQITIPASDTSFSDRDATSESLPSAEGITTQDNSLPPYAHARSYPQEVITRNVYVIVYDPILSNGQYLSDYLGWNDYEVLTRETVEFFHRVTNDRLQYNIVYTTVVTDGWPAKIDGFRYTEAEYLAVINGQRTPHYPDTVDYNAIVNSTALDICGKANRGEIDEVWVYNGPYFGFYESTLVGPGAYWYNSPPVPGPHNCQRLIPIMGPSPERGLDCAIHNFGHRMEATMTRVYGSGRQNSIAHNWERFTLVKALSPDYSYSGCGNIHYPPNSQKDSDYRNLLYTPSTCDEFFNYPNLGVSPHLIVVTLLPVEVQAGEL